MKQAEGPPSELDFARARRAVEFGWVGPAEVDAARIAEDSSPGAGVVARLGLNDGQRIALESPPFPADVADALRKPRGSVGRFALLEQLGSGGMGDVWRAWDLRLARVVALKVLRRLADDRARACFEREARVLATLRLDGVPAIHEIGEDDGTPHIAMQLIEGETLAAMAKPLDARRAAELIVAAARVVDAAHRAGIVHRDIKPSNIMIERGGRVFITDFGLARPIIASLGWSLTGSAVLVGTPEYMPPEQARGAGAAASADARSDVYALGACLFELITGRPPFVSDNRAEVIAQVLRDDPPRPGTIAAGTPLALEAVTLRCLAKDPARRYPTAAALAEDLERFLAGAPVAAPRPPLARRWRLRLAALAAGAILLAAATLLPLGPRAAAADPVLLWRGSPDVTVRSIAADAERVYFSIDRHDARGHEIAAIPHDGGGAAAALLRTTDTPLGIALAGDALFWVDPNAGSVGKSTCVFRARKDGRGPARVIYEGWAKSPPIEDGCGIATDGGALFIVDEVGGRVARFGLDGSGGEPLAPARYPGGFATEHMNSIAVANGVVFVADPGMKDVNAPEVVTVPVSGGEWRRIWSGPPLVGPRGIAVEGETIYLVDPPAGNAIWALQASGGAPPRLLRSGPPVREVVSIAISGRSIFIGDGGYVRDVRANLMAGPPAIWRIDLGRAD